MRCRESNNNVRRRTWACLCEPLLCGGVRGSERAPLVKKSVHLLYHGAGVRPRPPHLASGHGTFQKLLCGRSVCRPKLRSCGVVGDAELLLRSTHSTHAGVAVRNHAVKVPL